MNFINKFKNIFYKSALNNALKGKNYQREIMNLDDSKGIGIIFNASKTNDVITVTDFANILRKENKEVTILGYQNRKLKMDMDPRLFDNNSLSWFSVPNDKKINIFQKLNLDVLICAFEDECLPLEYIAATSKAKFRLGAFSNEKTNYYELMVNIKKKQELKYLLNQILHFLKTINKDV